MTAELLPELVCACFFASWGEGDLDLGPWTRKKDCDQVFCRKSKSCFRVDVKAGSSSWQAHDYMGMAEVRIHTLKTMVACWAAAAWLYGGRSFAAVQSAMAASHAVGPAATGGFQLNVSGDARYWH